MTDHDHAHGHDHDRSHHDHSHDHAHTHDHAHSHAHTHDHSHAHDHAHSGGFWAGLLNHNHSHAHDHHGEEVSDGRLLVSIALNLALTVLEVVAGLVSGSLALLADAAHNFNDCAALMIAYAARKIGRRGADRRFTFGYRRAELIGAMVNLTALLVVGVGLLAEAAERMWSPQPVKPGWMMIAASVALVVDVGTAGLLWAMSKGNLNVRAAFVHNLTDAFGSLVVLVAGVAIALWGWTWLDPVLTVILALYILATSVGMLRRTASILMENTPPGLELDTLQARLEALEGVHAVHHIHAWELDETRRALEAHVVLAQDVRLEQLPEIKRAAKTCLRDDFGIQHATLEFETYDEVCGSGDVQTPCWDGERAPEASA